MRTIYNRIRASLTLRWTALVVAFAIGAGGIGYGVNSAINGSDAALRGVDEREQVQVERCEAGNKLRTTLQEEKQEELTEVKSHGVPFYEKFLNGTEAQIRQLRQESIEKVEERINRYAPENCKVVVK